MSDILSSLANNLAENSTIINAKIVSLVLKSDSYPPNKSDLFQISKNIWQCNIKTLQNYAIWIQIAL